MKYLNTTIIISLAFLISYCGVHRVDYDIGLYEVNKSFIKNGNQAEHKTIAFQEHAKIEYNFKDETIQMIWRPTSSRFFFTLTNKTDQPIMLIWDKVRYIDESDTRIPVIHSGIPYHDRYNPQRSMKIAGGSSISDFILPADHVYYVSQKFGGDWREMPLFADLSVISAQELSDKAEKNIGRTIQVFMPIEIEDIHIEYIFLFKIHDFWIK
ncbi:MAG: hypothetical protein JW932_00620 [Deltaproteobacteria bacterium]|nr:hypothetical protein [Deltaproteobacteria bacterium]